MKPLTHIILLSFPLPLHLDPDGHPSEFMVRVIISKPFTSYSSHSRHPLRLDRKLASDKHGCTLEKQSRLCYSPHLATSAIAFLLIFSSHVPSYVVLEIIDIVSLCSWSLWKPKHWLAMSSIEKVIKKIMSSIEKDKRRQCFHSFLNRENIESGDFILYMVHIVGTC